MSKTTGEISHFQSVRDFRIAASDGATVVDSAGNLVIPVLPLVVTATCATWANGDSIPPEICVGVSDGGNSRQLSCESGGSATANFSACEIKLVSGKHFIIDPSTGENIYSTVCKCTLRVNLRSVHYTGGEAVIAVEGGIGSESGEHSPDEISLDVSWNGYKSNGSFRTCGICGNLQPWFVIKIRKTNWSASVAYEIETIPSSGKCGKDEDEEEEINVKAPYRWCNAEYTVFTEKYPVINGDYIWGKKEVNITYDPDETTEEEAKAKAALSKVASTANNKYFIGGTANTRYWRDEKKDAYSDAVWLNELRDSNMNIIYITYGITDDYRPNIVDYYTPTGQKSASGHPIVVHGGTVACTYEKVYAQQAINSSPKWGVGFRDGYKITTQSTTVYTDKVTENTDDNGEPYYASIDKTFEHYEKRATELCRGIDTGVRGSYVGAWDADGFLDPERVQDAGVIEVALSPVIRIGGVTYADVWFHGSIPTSSVVVDSLLKAYSTVPCGQQKTVFVREDKQKYYETAADASKDTGGVNLPAISNGVYNMVSIAGSTYYYEQNLSETDALVG